MIKNYIYAGAVLLVLAVVLFYSVSSYITSGTPTSIRNLTVQGHGLGDVLVPINSSAVSILFVFASNYTDIYFMNQSLFGGLSSYIAANSSGSAYSYLSSQGINGTDVFRDNTIAVKEFYQTANSSAAGQEIYAVVDSTPGSPSYNGVVSASVVYKAYSYGNWVGKSGEALVAIILLIAGVALLIYGAVKKPKEIVLAETQAKPANKKRKTS